MNKRTLIILTAALTLITALPAIAGPYKQGRKYYTQRKYDKAREMFLKAAEKTDSGNAYYFLGEIEKLKSNFSESEEYYRMAISKKSISRQYLRNAYWNILILAEQRGDYGTVIKVCREMWNRIKNYQARKKVDSLINRQMWSENEDAVKLYKRGISYKKSGESAQARETFKEAINKDSSFLAPKFELGMMAYRKNDLDTAASYLDDIASRIDFYAEVHLILGNINYRKKNCSRAIDHYNKVFEYGFINTKTEAYIHTRRGTCYFNTGNNDKAEADIARAIRKGGKTIGTYTLLSAILIKQGKYDEALETLRKARKMSPKSLSIIYQIGSLYYRKKDIKYMHYFDKLFDMAVQRKSYSRKYKKAFLILAREHYEKKNFTRVNKILPEIRGSDTSYDTILLTAKTYYNVRKYEKAIEYFEKISVSGDDRFTLCLAYAKSGRRTRAKELLDQLISDETFYSKAKKSRTLSGILREIEIEKKRKIEEEERKRKEEQKRLEELERQRKLKEKEELEKKSSRTDNKSTT